MAESGKRAIKHSATVDVGSIPVDGKATVLVSLPSYSFAEVGDVVVVNAPTLESGLSASAFMSADSVITLRVENHMEGVKAQGTLTLDTNPVDVASQGTLTVDTNPTDGDTMTVDAKVYTFETTLTNVDGNIQIAGTAALTQANIVAAFDLSGVAGTDYATLMTAHPTVNIAAFAADNAVLTAKVPGAGGDSIATTETFFTGTNIFDGATLGTTTAGSADTMTVDTKTYTFNSVLINADGNIKIGATLAATKANIVAAFDLSGVAGTDYAATMTVHPSVTIAAFVVDDAVLTAQSAGVAGNSLDTTETFTAVTNVFDAATLGTTTAGDDGAPANPGSQMYYFAVIR